MVNKVKIAITGGPSGGKTTLIETLVKNLGKRVSVVPEAATILYKGGFPRKKTVSSIQHTQVAIYHTQQQLEEIISIEHSASYVICDRGSLDGLAYWPGDSNAYLEKLNTTAQREAARYNWVLHLDTASKDFYDGESIIRTESHHEAVELNIKILTAWSVHPQRIIIPHYNDFLHKMTVCVNIIKMIMNNESHREIMKYVDSATHNKELK